jgi:peptidoglycan/LPS O-acetylase OafA/YrhL
MAALDRKTNKTDAYISPSFSILLDLLRFLAALLVVAGHITQPYFSKGWPNLTGMAFSMVAVFFVLSGFVIRYTADVKPFEPRAYFVSRLARIYSVLIPAIILTVVVDSISRYVNPNFYNFRFYEATTWLPLRIAAALLFVNQAYGFDIAVMSNSPIWSLGYEVPYYFLFGVYFYLRGWLRGLLIALICLMLGPNIFVLFPLWLSGCALYSLTKNQPIVPMRGLLLLCLLAVLIKWFWFMPDNYWPDFPATTHSLAWLWRGRSLAFPSFYAAGMLTLVGLMAAYHLQNWMAFPLFKMRRVIRILAAGAFSLYLYHFPLLILVRAVVPYDRSDALTKVAIFAVVFVACYTLAQITESKKHWYAAMIYRLLDAWRLIRAKITAEAVALKR